MSLIVQWCKKLDVKTNGLCIKYLSTNGLCGMAAPKSLERAKPLLIYERDKYETSLIGGACCCALDIMVGSCKFHNVMNFSNCDRK